MAPELLVMVGASVMGCGCVAGLWLEQKYSNIAFKHKL